MYKSAQALKINIKITDEVYLPSFEFEKKPLKKR